MSHRWILRQPVSSPSSATPDSPSRHRCPPPIEDQGYRQVYGINTAQIAEVTGMELAEDYVQLAEGQAGEINAIPVPMLDRGSHLSYAFQWIAFGIMARSAWATSSGRS